MKRWHKELHITQRAWKEHRQGHVESNKSRSVGYRFFQREPGSDPCEVECPCDMQVGRFRKTDAYDCGKAGCLYCHSDKFPKRKPTAQEKIAELRFYEQFQELCGGS